MKQKFITFIKWFLINGIGFGLLIYFGEKTSISRAVSAGIGFGFLMGLLEAFVFKKINKNKEHEY